jgi:hypothetical protein
MAGVSRSTPLEHVGGNCKQSRRFDLDNVDILSQQSQAVPKNQCRPPDQVEVKRLVPDDVLSDFGIDGPQKGEQIVRAQ